MAHKEGLFPNGLSIGAPPSKLLYLKPKFIENITFCIQSPEYKLVKRFFLRRLVGGYWWFIQGAQLDSNFQTIFQIEPERWSCRKIYCLSFTLFLMLPRSLIYWLLIRPLFIQTRISRLETRLWKKSFLCFLTRPPLGNNWKVWFSAFQQLRMLFKNLPIVKRMKKLIWKQQNYFGSISPN